MLRNKFLLTLTIAISWMLVKIKFLQRIIPRKVLNKLPLGWTDEMYSTVLKSRGKKVYVDIPCQLQQPISYQPKTAVDPAYQLTEADIQFFYQNGYIGPFTIVAPEVAEGIKSHLVEMLETESTVYPYSQNAYVIEAKDRATSQDRIRSNYDTSYLAMNYRDRHLDDSQLLDLFKHPALTERCAQLLGPDLLLWRTQFFPKAPSEEGTPLHQASTYLLDNLKEPVVYPPNLNELFQLTCWIALTDATKENGCMVVVKGTNKQIAPLKISKPYDTQKSDDGSKRFGTAKIEVDLQVNSEDVMPIEMKAGQFFIFSERSLHGSLGNQTAEGRWAVNGRIVRPDTRLYTDKMLKEGHMYKVVGVKDICLDRWQTVPIRGEDRFGCNQRLKDVPAGESIEPVKV
ncbi:MAG: hypothetical protein HC942_00875 [Microcoleus sp. SU_5_6]|nr:hypothetical protein [Microcoleus sp. SU_5_6]